MDEFLEYPQVLSSAGDLAGKYVESNAGVVAKVMQIINLKD